MSSSSRHCTKDKPRKDKSHKDKSRKCRPECKPERRPEPKPECRPEPKPECRIECFPLQLSYFITPPIYIEGVTTHLTLTYEIQNTQAHRFAESVVIIDSLVGTPLNYGILRLNPNETIRIDVTYPLTPDDFALDRLVGTAFIALRADQKRVSNIATATTEKAPGGINPNTGEYVLQLAVDITPDQYIIVPGGTQLTLRANVTNTLSTPVSYPILLVASLGVLGNLTYNLGTISLGPNETKTYTRPFTLTPAEELLALLILSVFLTLPGEPHGIRLSNIANASASAATATISKFTYQFADSTDKVADPYYTGPFSNGYIIDPVTNTVNLRVYYTLKINGIGTVVDETIYWAASELPTTIGVGGVGNTPEIFVANTTVRSDGGTIIPFQVNQETGRIFPVGTPYIDISTGQGINLRNYVIFSFQLADAQGQLITVADPIVGWNYPIDRGSPDTVYPQANYPISANATAPDGKFSSYAETSFQIALSRYRVNVLTVFGPGGLYGVYAAYAKRTEQFLNNTPLDPNNINIGLLGGPNHSGNYGYTTEFEGTLLGDKTPAGQSTSSWVNPPATIDFSTG